MDIKKADWPQVVCVVQLERRVHLRVMSLSPLVATHCLSLEVLGLLFSFCAAFINL